MDMMDFFKNTLPYVQDVCWAVIIGGGLYIVYRRCKVKVVSLDMIKEWAESKKTLGSDMFVSKLSVMPNEVIKSVHSKLGTSVIINGYKDNGSVFVTILDAEGKIVCTNFFMGTRLDDELELAMGEKGLNIKL